MILISGAGGFIGKALHRRLATAGHEVLALTRGDSFRAGSGEVSLNLEDAAHCRQLLQYCADCTALVHLAGRIAIQLAPSADQYDSPRATASQFADLYQGNLVMTARLLEMAQVANVPHVVFASSQTVYGLPDTTLVVEDSPLRALEYYAASKIASETALQLWARGHGRKVSILRFPGVWGEHRQSGLVYSLCRQAIGEGRIRVGAEYPLPLDVLHCDDVVAAFEAALCRAGDDCRAYNVGTGEACSLTRLGQDVADLVPGCVIETFGVQQPDIALGVGRAATELGWRAQPRRERLSRFIDNMRAGIGNA